MRMRAPSKAGHGSQGDSSKIFIQAKAQNTSDVLNGLKGFNAVDLQMAQPFPLPRAANANQTQVDAILVQALGGRAKALQQSDHEEVKHKSSQQGNLDPKRS
jgi:hypothetical protein